MVDIIMTWLLRLFFWGFQLGILLLIAWVPAAFLAKSRRAGAVLLAVILLAECAVCGYLAYHPIVDVPEEYAEYVSAEEIREFNSGFYSANIPVFPVYIRVLKANEQETLVRTYYGFFGTTEMSVTADGPSITKPMFPSS
ncbi:MAG: hypothetical protein IJ001_04005 [Oscillospiraceae bacterium]|nr:hypothetical protein [Oscillospiraceae bacterium]